MKSKTPSTDYFKKRMQMICQMESRIDDMGIALSFDDEHKVMREMCSALDRNVSYVLIIVKNKDGCRRRSYELRDLDLRISIPPNPPLMGI